MHRHILVTMLTLILSASQIDSAFQMRRENLNVRLLSESTRRPMTSQGQSVVSARREFGERARDGQSQDPTFVANPKTEEEYFQNGNALMVAGDWVKAEQNFRSAISLRSDNAIYHIALIFALA